MFTGSGSLVFILMFNICTGFQPLGEDEDTVGQLKLQFKLNDSDVTFNLVRDLTVKDMKVFVGREAGIEEFVEKEEDMLFYTDPSYLASVGVRIQNGKPTTENVEGDFFIDDTHYKLKPIKPNSTDTPRRPNSTDGIEPLPKHVIHEGLYLVTQDVVEDQNDTSQYRSDGTQHSDDDNEITSERNARNTSDAKQKNYQVVNVTVSKENSSSCRLQNNSTNATQQQNCSADSVTPTKQPIIKKHYFVESLVAIDYGVYSRWWRRLNISDENQREIQAVKDLKWYYSHIFNGINLRYKNIQEEDFSLEVRFVAIYIATSPSASPWTESLRVKDTVNGTTYVEARKALSSFTQWLYWNRRILPRHDHGLLITGYVLWRGFEEDGARKRILGNGDFRICGYWRAGISMDLGVFGTSHIGAHEIGHGFSLRHDGDGNNCSSFDQHVMANASTWVSDKNYKSVYYFSNCSVDGMRQYFKYLDSVDNNCLENNATDQPGIGLLDFPELLPGRVLTYDEQCEVIHGNGSFYCAGDWHDSRICRQFVCYDPARGHCFASSDIRAAPGTTCGNKTWCIESDCVNSTYAPEAKEYCRTGEYKRLFSDGNNCSSMVVNQTGKCHYDYYRGMCCESCETVRRPNNTLCPFGDASDKCVNVTMDTRIMCYRLEDECCDTCPQFNDTDNPECPFGDRWEACVNVTKSDCYHRGSSDCCESCKTKFNQTRIEGCEFGDRAEWCNNSFPGNCYVNNYTCCELCANTFDLTKPGCHYGDKASWCPTEKPYRCYHPNTENTCCETCAKFKTGPPGCEYGDRRIGCTLKSCKEPIRWRSCCHTCQAYLTTIPPSTTTPAPTGPECTGDDQASWCYRVTDYNCYRDYRTCCRSCRRFWKPVTGCEFGDKSPWCFMRRLSVCDEGEYYRDLCCELCANWKPATTFLPTTVTQPTKACRDKANWCSDIQAYQCYSSESICCERCSYLYIGTTTECRYGDKAGWCSGKRKEECYRSDVSNQCCLFCSRMRENVPGCEYGDRRSNCRSDSCRRITEREKCCKTCKNIPLMVTAAPLCPGGDQVNWCPSIYSGECYNYNTRSRCCRTCYYRHRGIAGCEYGDRYSWCSSGQHCRSRKRDCCSSCS